MFLNPQEPDQPPAYSRSCPRVGLQAPKFPQCLLRCRARLGGEQVQPAAQVGKLVETAVRQPAGEARLPSDD
jgi:hypothetical protein